MTTARHIIELSNHKLAPVHVQAKTEEREITDRRLQEKGDDDNKK